MKDDTACLVVMTPGFPADENDSACLPWVQSFIRSINELFPRLKIAIIALEYPFKDESYTWFNNEVTSFDGWKKNKIQKLLIWLRIWRSFNRLRKKYRIAGIVSYWCGEAAFVGNICAKRTTLKHIIRICGQDAGKENKWVQRIRPTPAELVPLSDFLADEFFRNHGIRPNKVVPMAIDPQSFPPVIPRERDVDILGVGALIPLKRYDLFVEIVHELIRQFPHLKAIHCGSGYEEPRIKQKISDLHLQENISLAGKAPHGEILMMMQRAKVFLHTSEYEGFSAACLEALYAGAFVISFCKPMNTDIENWYIVHSKEEMIKKTIELLQKPHVPVRQRFLYTSDESARAIMKILGYKEN